MALVDQISTTFTRVGTEFKSVRTDIGSLAALTTADKSTIVAAINEVQSEVGAASGATNLAATLSATQTVVTSDTGTDATIPSVDGTNAGVMTPTMKSKLDGIEAAADVTDAGNVGSTIHGASTKAAAVDADTLALIDSEAANVLKKLSIANLKNVIQAMIQTGAPATLDTLDELAAALGDDPNAITTITTALGNRVRTDTAAQGLNGTQQSNARTNIAAQASSEIGNTATDFVAIFEAA